MTEQNRPRATGLAAVTLLAVLLVRGPAMVAPAMAHEHGRGHEMTDAQMQRMVDAHFAGRPTTPSSGAHPEAAATYRVINFRFDADFNPNGTPVDTVHIQAGESVDWVYVSGAHTTTNGTDPDDPNLGLLWDEPVDAGHPLYSRTFPTPGTFPFFCIFHELTMTGVIVVSSGTSGVEPIDAPSQRLGFVAGPSPNPSHGVVTFRFNLQAEGAVSVGVYDVTGRRVALPVDSTLPAGTWGAEWDGQTSDGVPAASGVYYIKLTTPVGIDIRPVTLVR